MGLLVYVERLIFTGVVDAFTHALNTGAPTTHIFDEVNARVDRMQMFIYGVIIILSVLSGLIATQLALRPVRQSLITQRRFIGSVAHELRTPLAILKTQNEVARLEIDPHSIVGETLVQNVEEIDHITEILNNLLLFSRVNTHESIVFDTVDLEAIIKAVISRLTKLAEKKGVRLLFECVAMPRVYGNATALEQAIFNVVKNGINYTKRGGEVTVTCTLITPTEVTLCVSDTGIGIEKKELAHVFEPFYRTHSGQETNNGTGLGLALVFEIIKLHGGKIRIESTEGVGTRIQMTIPCRPHILRAAPKRTHDKGVSYDFTPENDAF